MSRGLKWLWLTARLIWLVDLWPRERWIALYEERGQLFRGERE